MELAATLEGHSARVWDISWSPTGSLLASCSGDKSIRLWGPAVRGAEQEDESWVCKGTLTGQHSRTVRSVAWSPCGMKLAAGSFDATASIWDRSEGGMLRQQFQRFAPLNLRHIYVLIVSSSTVVPGCGMMCFLLSELPLLKPAASSL